MAVRTVLEPFDGESMSTRAHVAVRWLSCPFGAVLDALPQAGEVLDVGCGHGILSLELARRQGVSVLGVDVDDAKVQVARRAAARAGASHARFETVDPAGVPEGAWAAIAVVDALYLMPAERQEELLACLATRLRPGGSLVVKEMDTTPRAKAFWMRTQERLAVRALHITRGDTLAFTDAASLERTMSAAGLRTATTRVDRRYPHPHVLVVGTKP